MPPRKAKTRGSLAGAESGAARFRWCGQMTKPLALVVAIAAPLAALTAGTSALSATPARQPVNYMWAIPRVGIADRARQPASNAAAGRGARLSDPLHRPPRPSGVCRRQRRLHQTLQALLRRFQAQRSAVLQSRRESDSDRDRAPARTTTVGPQDLELDVPREADPTYGRQPARHHGSHQATLHPQPAALRKSRPVHRQRIDILRRIRNGNRSGPLLKVLAS